MRNPDDVLAELTRIRAQDPPTHGGRVLSYVYDHGRPELDRLVADAAGQFLPVNGLDPTTYASVARLERDLVAFTRSVLHGDGEVAGSVTSGGTESCLLAVKSARDVFVADVPDGEPVMVLPTTAHPAFRKAAHYLRVGIREVPVDVATGTPAPSAVLAAVEELTHAGHPPALVVLSAPSYPFGVVDPIAELAPLLATRGVAVHVDACIGGWLLPWWPQELPAWDFTVAGVTSISTDLHKYGYAPKGASVVLYRGRERHRAQYFATASWPGYPVVNPTVLGSRSATALAAAWAVTQTLGTEGYAELVSRTARATAELTIAVEGIEGLAVYGAPDSALLALVADPAVPAHARVDPFLLVDRVRERGFLLQAQPALTQRDGTVLPRSAHLTITPVTEDIVEELTAALRSAAAATRGVPPPVAEPALVGEVARDGLPAELAPVMATLEALDRDTAPAALTALLAAVIDPDLAPPAGAGPAPRP